MQVANIPTVGDMVLERVVEHLGRYRELVAKAASGWSLTSDEAEQAEKLLHDLELPTWSLRRDVDATRTMWAAETEHRRVELAWVYPHLFADRRQWADLRRNERAVRRRVMAELREATSGIR